MSDYFKEVSEDTSTPFFTQEDYASIKGTFISSLKGGIAIAAFVAPTILVLGIGSMVGNFFKK